MKTNKFRQLKALMNEELLVSYQKTIDKLAFLLAVKIELTDKEDLPVEETLTEEAAERISKTQALLAPLFFSLQDSSTLQETLFGFDIFSVPFVENFITLYEYRKESSQKSVFDIHEPDLEELKEDILTFLQREVFVCRLQSWLNDITNGIEQYGVSSYLIPDEDDTLDPINGIDGLVKNIDSLDARACVEEILPYLIEDEDDNDSDIQDKEGLLVLIETLGKYSGGKDK